MPAANNRGLILALTGIGLLLAVTFIAYRPVAPLGPDAAPTLFSARRAGDILQALVGNGVPHPLGSAANARVREAIVKRLAAMGYVPELQSGFVCNDAGACGSPVNIVATLRGGAGDGDAILLAAHYDSVPAGPGASDDAAGVAIALEIARALRALPAPRHPVELLLTDGEEAGLLGALLFARDHPRFQHVTAAVNLDSRGTSGPSLMFETGTANSWLMRLYGSAVARPVTNSLFYVVYKLLPNDTDFTVFKKMGLQGFNFAFVGNVGRYHTHLDSLANADAGSLQHHGDNALSVLLALANSATLNPPARDAVFFDGFAHTLIAWPAQFTLPAALLAMALLLAETAFLGRKGAVTFRRIAWGWVGTLGSLVLGTGVSAALLAVLLAVGKIPPLSGESWIAQPLPMHLAAAATAFLAAGIVSAWLARRAGFWGFWSGTAVLVAGAAVVCAVFVPGASFPLLLTAVAASLGALPVMAGRWKSLAAPGAAEFAAVFPALVMFGAAFPLVRFLYMALGSLAWPVSTLVLGLGTATLLPLLAAAGVGARRGFIGAATLTAVGGVLITFTLPTYTTDWPERINLEYRFDADTGRAHYLAQCGCLRLPAALTAVAHFDPVPHPRFIGSGSAAFYAPAPRAPAPGAPALAAPELSSQSNQSAQPTAILPSAGVTAGPTAHFNVRLRSARGAPEAFVVFPASARVTEVMISTPTGVVPARPYPMRSGATLLDIVELPADGLNFSFDLAGSGPQPIQIFDQSFDFPAAGEILQRARPPTATSSQDGDITVVHRTVSLEPAAGR